MAPKLPPLNALRGFEAAARHLSFTKAAEELNVTQAAVSHQIKALEERLGIELFRRTGRGLALTDAGRVYVPAVREAFDRIAEATQRLSESEEGGRLTVSTMHSFAASWLVPRLARFRARHPDIDVLIDAVDHLVQFSRSPVDIGIRYGRGDWPGVRAELLMTEDIFPVCSPVLLDGDHPLTEPAALRHHTLLHDDMKQNWEVWLSSAGLTGIDASAGLGFTNSRFVLQAAIDGLGVALARSTLVEDDLAAGRLVRPFALALPSEYAYYVASAPGDWDKPKVAAFRDWLKDEAAKEGAREMPYPEGARDRLSGSIKTEIE